MRGKNADEILSALQNAGGGPDALALAAAEIIIAAKDSRLRPVLDAAAIPHWFDASAIATLLDISDQEAGIFIESLEELRLIEKHRDPFTYGVIQHTRSAIRSRLFFESKKQFTELSSRAFKYYSKLASPIGRIEAIYQLIHVSPSAAGRALDQLWLEWPSAEQRAPLQQLDLYLREPLFSKQLFEPAGHTKSEDRRAFYAIRAKLTPLDLNPRRFEAARLFISYTHSDTRHLKTLLNYLQPIHRSGNVVIWCDLEIRPGDVWDQVIREQLETADIYLMLVSASFIASRYINSVELETALRRHNAGEAKVAPIILDHCPWKRTALGQLQATTRNGKPIVDYSPRSKGWNEVEDQIFGIAKDVPRWINPTRTLNPS